ncbi:hypothetical protein FAES_4040 [Fibrella aestuarina BUZ 2]|uniref:Uncharacterized protein n=1 Tax=Fibrella aestuarina BUZ 2 TaxID=1166018 RepID=I0KD37_9BACT|nr:hypothetical protein [Fibrella aestuarina]CCH02040.1 hypothetical protein FAES_4040 [Fibrella aestuarina BUZ 2]
MNTLQPTEEHIRKAATIVADLWAAQLQKPLNKDNGDDNPMLFLLTAQPTIQAQATITAEQMETFKASLIQQIINEMMPSDKRPNGRLAMCVGTDYGPDWHLAPAAEKAGIPDICFPWKSQTYISLDRNEINSQFGYSARAQTVAIQ